MTVRGPRPTTIAIDEAPSLPVAPLALPPHDSQPPEGEWEVTADACFVTERGLLALNDYSCSLPTGTTVGKVWKRRNDYSDESKGWVLGFYAPCAEPDKVLICWRPIRVLTRRQMQVRRAERAVAIEWARDEADPLIYGPPSVMIYNGSTWDRLQ